MNALLDRMARSCDRGEVFALRSKYHGLEYKNGSLHKLEHGETRGRTLRVVKDGRLGMATSTAQGDDARLVTMAAEATTWGPEVEFTFPEGGLEAPVALKHLPGDRLPTTEEMEGWCARCAERMKAFDGDLTYEIHGGGGDVEISVGNTTGLQRAMTSKDFGMSIVVTEATAGDIFMWYASASDPFADEAALDAWMDRFLEDFALNRTLAEPLTGKVPVIISPNTLRPILAGLLSGTSAVSIHEGLSPLKGRLGEKVLSDVITMRDDPTFGHSSRTVPFDHEGVSTSVTPIFEEGIFRGFVTDLKYARKTGTAPTGNGFRLGGMGGGTQLDAAPSVAMTNLVFEGGKTPLDELLAGVDDGLWLEFVPDAFQGNVSNGDFTGGIRVGQRIRKGKRVGRVKNLSVSGNIYELLAQGKVELSRECSHPSAGGNTLWTPHFLLKEANVS